MRSLLCFLTIIVVSATPTRLNAATVRGAVRDQTGGLIGIASVGLYSGSGNWETLTDRSGRFVLENVPLGRYEFEVTAQGFLVHLERAYEVGETDLPALLITLQVGSSPPCPAGFMFVHGVDSPCYSGFGGDYTDGVGKPVLRGTVFALVDDYPNRSETRAPLINAAVVLTKMGQAKPLAESRTDEKGQFRFEGLDVGRYEVWIRHGGCVDGGASNVRIKYGKDLDIAFNEGCSQIPTP